MGPTASTTSASVCTWCLDSLASALGSSEIRMELEAGIGGLCKTRAMKSKPTCCYCFGCILGFAAYPELAIWPKKIVTESLGLVVVAKRPTRRLNAG